MALEMNGKTIKTNDNGYLEDQSDWSEDVAKAIAASDDIELAERHWDVINFLREEYFDSKRLVNPL